MRLPRTFQVLAMTTPFYLCEALSPVFARPDLSGRSNLGGAVKEIPKKSGKIGETLDKVGRRDL